MRSCGLGAIDAEDGGSARAACALTRIDAPPRNRNWERVMNG